MELGISELSRCFKAGSTDIAAEFLCLPEQIPRCLVSSDLLIGFAGTRNVSCVEGPQGPSLAWIYFICCLLFFSLQFSLVCVLWGFLFLFLFNLSLSVLELFA